MEADLDLVFRLADEADRVSMSRYRSADVTKTTKADGTPVAEIDLAVEEAIYALIASTWPDDAALGEEIGLRPGGSGRRWILDGIDGTHNYAAGWPGWASIIALEVDGEVTHGMVSAPAFGRRWWAVRGGGAFTVQYTPGDFDGSAAVAMRCSDAGDLDRARVMVIPWEGFLLGWRDEVARRFRLPEWPRSECFAIDGARAAQGEIDVTILLFGGPWDVAATSLMIREAGGVFCDAWGGQRLDTWSGIFASPTLMKLALDQLAAIRPDQVDEPQMATNLHDQAAFGAYRPDEDGWRRFGVRRNVSMSARVHVNNAPPPVLSIVDERAACLEQPFTGITTDGTPLPNLRSLDVPKVDTAPIAEAALRFLQALTDDQRARARFPLDAQEWRTWINVHMNHFRHGVMLEDLAQPVRELGLDLLRVTLSARGYDQARSIMRLNELLAEISGDWSAFGEWPYFVSIFGDPASGEPWGWQIDGHHLCVNVMCVDGRVVTTPTFMGAEPRRVHEGKYAGISLFDPEEARGLDLIRSFDAGQRERAVIYPSLHPDEIPTHLQNLFDGRMQAGAFHDNAVLSYQGVAGAEMTDAQRRLVVALADSYLGWNADPHVPVRRREVEAHLDETWFSWYGGTGDRDPFYYRVHSPVLLIEFDHHPGVVLDNEAPTRHHVHTVVRTPNGGDYGTDLLARHHDRFDHAHGHHDPRRT